MQLTRYSDYAVRVLMYLALNGHRRCTTREIADAYGVSESHLTKVIHHLGESGFITTIRGEGGGLEMARPASGINLGAIYREFEPNFELAECFAGKERCACPIAGFCELTRALELALQAFLDVLDRHTLEDLLKAAPVLKGILIGNEEDGPRRVSARGTPTRRPVSGGSPRPCRIR